ncbi:cellulose synthase complex periplasmic endoglucanase BcsZ [Undibacterium sp. SXout20W]|uniref:cellulose synthase complex periplasmic endoglucanase BcsZ n=1 Tax=Undibacterium sp. SXout20W TaxID=3413051 RepID=UPI003BF1F1EC
MKPLFYPLCDSDSQTQPQTQSRPHHSHRSLRYQVKKILMAIVVGFGLCTSISSHSALASSSNCTTSWPEWEQFKRSFITDDGRVIDHSGNIKPTVSEGQAYAMFFALAANDKASFQSLLTWTENNLANGDLTARLPAWQWGQRPDNSWGVVDSNSATDADLWIAYTLGVAADVWKDKRYAALSTLIAQRILNEETAELPLLGLTLLPAPKGFALANNQWKLNPSYLPLQLLRWLEHHDRDPRWKKVIASSLKIINGASPKGYSADWILFNQEQGFSPDLQGIEKGDGGYNAIRVYLWVGMLAEKEIERASLLKMLQPMANLTANQGYPPEFVNIVSGQAKGVGSSGFSAALIPFLHASKNIKTLQQQQLRLAAQPIRTDRYYDQVLALFAQGWQDQRFRFQMNGTAEFAWQSVCKQKS